MAATLLQSLQRRDAVVFLKREHLQTILRSGSREEFLGERRDHDHPNQPNAEVDRCQDKSGLAYKTPNRAHS